MTTKPKFTPEAQDMIDMFNDLGVERWNELADLLVSGNFDFAIRFFTNYEKWVEAKPSED